MPDKYKDAISKIEASEELKEKIKNNVRLESKKNRKKVLHGGGIMMKLRKVVAWIAGVAALAACGGAVYAGITGNYLNIFNNKVSEKYEEYAEVIEGKFVEDDYSKITLKSLACDDAYLIIEYKLDVKEKGEKEFSEKKDDDVTGLELTLNNGIKINGKEYDGMSTFSNQVANKDGKNSATIYKMYDLTDMEVPDDFEIELYDFSWMDEKEEEESVVKNQKIIDGSMSLKVSKAAAKKDTVDIDPEIDKYSYGNLDMEVVKIVKTPFESFIIINTKEKVTEGRFASTREDPVTDLYISVLDENKKVLHKSEKFSGKILLKDGSYWSENGEVLNIAYCEPGENVDVEGAVIESRYVITANLDDAKTINIIPYYRKFIDNGTSEEEYLSSLKWYKVEDGKYTIKNDKGAEVKVTKVEIKDDRILFYYTKNEKVSECSLHIRNKDRAFNYMNPDIQETENKGEYVAGIKLVGNESSGLTTYEDGDTVDTADPAKYAFETYLKDIDSLVFTIDLGNESMTEDIGDGIIINLK